jgi:hypothetical protein
VGDGERWLGQCRGRRCIAMDPDVEHLVKLVRARCEEALDQVELAEAEARLEVRPQVVVDPPEF